MAAVPGFFSVVAQDEISFIRDTALGRGLSVITDVGLLPVYAHSSVRVYADGVPPDPDDPFDQSIVDLI